VEVCWGVCGEQRGGGRWGGGGGERVCVCMILHTLKCARLETSSRFRALLGTHTHSFPLSPPAINDR